MAPKKKTDLGAALTGLILGAVESSPTGPIEVWYASDGAFKNKIFTSPKLRRMVPQANRHSN